MSVEGTNRYVITDGVNYAENESATKFSQKIQSSFRWKDYDSAVHAFNYARKRKIDAISKDFYVHEITVYPIPLSQDVLASLYDMKVFTDLVDRCKNESDSWSEELSRVDRELTDLEHMLEIDSFSASQGFKVAKRIHELRVKRREIKDNLVIATCLSNIPNACIDSIKSNMYSLSTRNYVPRSSDFTEIV